MRSAGKIAARVVIALLLAYACTLQASYVQTPNTGAAPGGSCGGDLGGTFPNCTVVATHLTNPLPINQGGTNESTFAVNPFTSSSGTSAIALNAVQLQTWQEALTENTTCSISGIQSGQQITFIIVQNASAAKSFTCGHSQHVNGFMTVDATLSSINIQTCTASNNGTDLYCTPGEVAITGGTP